MKLNRKSSRKGFTLVEILIAVAALGLLAAFTVPKLRNVFTKTQETEMTHNAKVVNDLLESFEGMGGTFGTYSKGTETTNGVLGTTDPIADLVSGVFVNGQLLSLPATPLVTGYTFDATSHRYE